MPEHPLRDTSSSPSWGTVARSLVALIALVVMVVLWAEHHDHEALFAGWVCLAQVAAEVFG